jgi:hypothetical protein
MEVTSNSKRFSVLSNELGLSVDGCGEFKDI